MSLYASIVRPLAFQLEPERAHRLALRAGAMVAFAPPAMRSCYRVDDLPFPGRPPPNSFASGGVFTAEDAYAKIKLGASLVQWLTALVYEGPGVVRRINQGLAALFARDGFNHVADAVGAEAN